MARSAAVITGAFGCTVGSAYSLTDYIIFPSWMPKEKDAAIPERRKQGFFMGKATDPKQDWGLDYEQISDNWWVRGDKESSEWIVGVHGAGNDKREMLKYLNELRRTTSASILLTDVSKESGITMGVQEHEDILEAVKIAKSNGGEKIVIMGTSQGASSAMLAAAKLQSSIHGLILENPFCCGSEVIQHSLDKVFDKVSGHAPDPLLERSTQKARESNPFIGPLLDLRSYVPTSYLHLVHNLALSRMGYDPDRHSPISIAHTLTVPVLFMHGTDDHFVPISHTQRLAAAVGSDIVDEWYPAAGHSQLFNAQPDAFVEKVSSFYHSI